MGELDGYVRGKSLSLGNLQSFKELRLPKRTSRDLKLSKSDAKRSGRPKIKTTSMSYRVAPTDKVAAAKIAKARGQSLSDFMIEAARTLAEREGYAWDDIGAKGLSDAGKAKS